MAIYIIIYLLILILASLDFINVEEKYKKITLLCIYVILLLFRGVRWEVGTDWAQFLTCFQNARWNNIFTYYRYDELYELMEPGYMFLNVLINNIGNYSLFLTLTNAFILGTWLFLSVKLTHRPIFAFAFILIFNLIFPIRLQLAAAVICWTYYLSFKKKYVAALLVCIVAYTIHKSALFLIPFVFIINKELPKWMVWFLFGLSFLGEMLADYISVVVLFSAMYLPENLRDNVIGYSDAVIHGYSEKSFISILMSAFLYFFFLYSFIKARDIIKESLVQTKNKIHRGNYIIFNAFFNCYVFFNFFFKFFSAEMLTNFTRISEYFTVGFGIAAAISIDYWRKYLNESILYTLFCFYYLYKLKGLLLGTPYPEAMFPYKTIFGL
jgi:hypothetical protein